MTRISIVLAIIGTIALAGGAAGHERDHFAGVWAGVDTDDGSTRTVQISAAGDDGFKLAWAESHWSVCSGLRAIMRGDGQIDDDGVLVFEIQIVCFSPREGEEILAVEHDVIEFELVGKNLLLASATESGVF